MMDDDIHRMLGKKQKQEMSSTRYPHDSDFHNKKCAMFRKEEMNF